MKYLVWGIKGFLIVLALYFILYTPYPTYAEESSTSADIQKKLDQLKQDIASKAAKIKQEVNKKLTNRVFVGTIQTKTTDTITIASKNGSKLISTNSDTEYQNLNPKSKALKFGDLKEEATVAAIGDLDEAGVLTAKQILLLPVTLLQSKIHLWGAVTSTSKTSIVVDDKNKKSFEVLIDKNTEIKSGEKEITLKDIQKDQKLIVSGFLNEEDAIEASLISVILEGSAQASASPSASASASLKASPSPKVSPKASVKPSTSPSASVR